jgi:hypothetical protein
MSSGPKQPKVDACMFPFSLGNSTNLTAVKWSQHRELQGAATGKVTGRGKGLIGLAVGTEAFEERLPSRGPSIHQVSSPRSMTATDECRPETKTLRHKHIKSHTDSLALACDDSTQDFFAQSYEDAMGHVWSLCAHAVGLQSRRVWAGFLHPGAYCRHFLEP